MATPAHLQLAVVDGARLLNLSPLPPPVSEFQKPAERAYIRFMFEGAPSAVRWQPTHGRGILRRWFGRSAP